MQRFRIAWGKAWPFLKRGVQLTVSGMVCALAAVLFFYPAVIICLVVNDPQLSHTAQSRLLPGWFESAAGRFLSWANTYVASDYAQAQDHENVPATEWPMAGAVFLLATAEALQESGQIDARQGTIRAAVERAAEIVAAPGTATWVKTKWGAGYLEKENIFYRMLLILGLSSYERITGDLRYRALMSGQRTSLAKEMAGARLHLLEDYPGECYPNDVLWAVAAIQRAARLEKTQQAELAQSLIAVFDGPLRTAMGLPAAQANAKSGCILQDARGCGNSGILLFAAELDPEVAGRWFAAYEKSFWKDNGWIVGFTELPLGSGEKFTDVDSGPVLFEFGSAASVFGIGAAKAVGRFDRAAPLTMEAIACAWPTPCGFMLPGLMGWLAVRSWSLGEVALLFSMSRPTLAAATVPFTGQAPWIVWVLAAGYVGAGVFFIWSEIRACRCLLRRNRAQSGAGGRLHP